MAEFGEQLKKAREAKGITQQSLADKMYVTRQTIYRWECGDRYPDIINLKRLSNILEVSTDTLLSDDEMGKVVEKTPVVEKPWINNIMVCLYALVCFLLSVIVTKDLSFVIKSFPTLEVIGDNEFFVVLAIVIEILKVLLFAYGLINLVIGKSTPKQVGIVTIMYFVLEALANMRVMTHLSSLDQSAKYTCLFMFPYLVGAIGAFFFFCQKESKLYARLLIFISAGFGIVRQLFAMTLQFTTARLFFDDYYLFIGILKIAIFVTIIYQVCVLHIRRKQVANITK